MRISLLGFLLWSGFCLAQSPTGQMGSVTVSSVDATSASQVSSEHLQAIRVEIESHSYPMAYPEEIVERARYTLQRQGYFEADVRWPDTPSMIPVARTLAVTLAIREGQQYRLNKITFNRDKQYSEWQLRQLFAIADGDLFDVEKIRQGLDQLRELYGSRGYINFVAVPNTKPDEDTGTVTLEMDCDEGKQFRFGELVVEGGELHPGDTEKMLAAWKTYDGQGYDPNKLQCCRPISCPFLFVATPKDSARHFRRRLLSMTDFGSPARPTGLSLITERHQFIYLGDDAVLFGKRWYGNFEGTD